MQVTVSVAGGADHDVEVPEGTTYADLLAPLDVSPHEVSVLVEGHSVPLDQPVAAESVEVVRLVKGG